MRQLEIRNWARLQHYKAGKNARGAPPWIKLYTRLLDDPEFMELSSVERGNLMMLWILASHMGGRIPASEAYLRRRLNTPELRLAPLIAAGWLTDPEGGERETPTGGGPEVQGTPGSVDGGQDPMVAAADEILGSGPDAHATESNPRISDVEEILGRNPCAATGCENPRNFLGQIKKEKKRKKEEPIPKSRDRARASDASPTPIGAIIGNLSDPVSTAQIVVGGSALGPEPLAQRIVNLTGEPHWRSWWTTVLSQLLERPAGYLELADAVRHVADAQDPGTRAVKDVGEMREPGKYLVGRITRIMRAHRLRWPTFPQKGAPAVAAEGGKAYGRG